MERGFADLTNWGTNGAEARLGDDILTHAVSAEQRRFGSTSLFGAHAFAPVCQVEGGQRLFFFSKSHVRTGEVCQAEW